MSTTFKNSTMKNGKLPWIVANVKLCGLENLSVSSKSFECINMMK